MTGYYNTSFSLGGEALDLAEENNIAQKPDWIGMFFQFCFGAPLGMLFGYTIGGIFTRRSSHLSDINIPYLLIGSALIVGAAFMIHGDKLLRQVRVIPFEQLY